MMKWNLLDFLGLGFLVDDEPARPVRRRHRGSGMTNEQKAIIQAFGQVNTELRRHRQRMDAIVDDMKALKEEIAHLENRLNEKQNDECRHFQTGGDQNGNLVCLTCGKGFGPAIALSAPQDREK